MKRLKNRKIRMLAFVLLATTILATPGWAGNDPSIKGKLREQIQNSMDQFIKNKTTGNKYYHYDPVANELLELTFDSLHKGIVRKGEFYVSCADFIDQNGRKIDIDFLVESAGSSPVTKQGVIHAINGKKRAYHLEETGKGSTSSKESPSNQEIQNAIDAAIKRNTVNGLYSLYDPVEGKLLRLTFSELHTGVKHDDPFYVSCADFIDQSGRKIDVDFIVTNSNGKLQNVQGLIHYVNGKKRPYSLKEKKDKPVRNHKGS